MDNQGDCVPGEIFLLLTNKLPEDERMDPNRYEGRAIWQMKSFVFNQEFIQELRGIFWT